jgi:hypothetical protein
MKIVDIAKMCHEVNRKYCQSIGDNSQLSWEESPQWQQDSAINGVSFQLANPEAPASASHDSWLEEKRNTGWKYGPIKDPDKKEHPCFVPYEELPVEQQIKDHLFKAVCKALIPFFLD